MTIARASGQTPEANGSAGATSIALTLNQDVVAGNAIMCVGKFRNGTPGFSDNLSNTYATDVSTTTDGNNGVKIGSCKDIANGGTCTVTFGTVTSSRIGISVMEYTFDGGAALDQTGSATGTGTSSAASGAVNTTVAAELLIGGGSDADGVTYTWTNSFAEVAGNTTSRHSMGDQVVAATGSYDATATLSAASDWHMAIATYSEVGGGGGGAAIRIRFPSEFSAMGVGGMLGGNRTN